MIFAKSFRQIAPGFAAQDAAVASQCRSYPSKAADNTRYRGAIPDRRKCSCSASRRLIPWSDPMTDLQRSHAELRAAVILAAKEICRLNSGSAVSPVLAKLRRVLRKSRTVAHDDRGRIAMRIRLELPNRGG